jgi:acetolactate synthase-1/2/3 large subunit
VLSSRDPFSVTLPLGRELWGEADAVLAVGTHLLYPLRMWGIDDALKVVRVDADPEEPARLYPPAATVVGDARAALARLIDVLPAHNRQRAARRDEMRQRQTAWKKRFRKLGPQAAILSAIRTELPEDGIFVDEVTQIGFAARLMFPVYEPRTFLSPGYQDNLGWGFATALGAQDARRDVPVLSISGDGGFLYTAMELATAVQNKIPLVTIVFNDGAFGNVRRIQEEMYGGRMIANELRNPDFVRFAESFGAAAERVRTPKALQAALKRAFKRRNGPTLIEMRVGPMPSPWEFILMPRVRGAR